MAGSCKLRENWSKMCQQESECSCWHDVEATRAIFAAVLSNHHCALQTLTLMMTCRHGKEWEKRAMANKMKKPKGTAEANRYLLSLQRWLI